MHISMKRQGNKTTMNSKWLFKFEDFSLSVVVVVVRLKSIHFAPVFGKRDWDTKTHKQYEFDIVHQIFIWMDLTNTHAHITK